MTGRRISQAGHLFLHLAMFTLSVEASGESAALRCGTKRTRGVMVKDVPQAAHMTT
jgi:hypothetical protein